MITKFPYQLVSSTFMNEPDKPWYENGENPQWAEPDMDAVRSWMLNIVHAPVDPSLSLRAGDEISKLAAYPRLVTRFAKWLTQLS